MIDEERSLMARVSELGGKNGSRAKAVKRHSFLLPPGVREAKKPNEGSAQGCFKKRKDRDGGRGKMDD